MVGLDLYAEQLDLDDLPGSLERIVAIFEGVHDGGGRSAVGRGMRYVLEVRAVRAAVYVALDDAADRLADLLCSRGATPAAARVAARAFWFGGYFGSLEQWHLDGRSRPLIDYIREALPVLTGERPLGRTR
ncbi:hypothetical protein ABZ897_37100 [Nonomuraea sp. NPDC046802]|uniref:hypothetical protein n=1 Tax=Nonomuraea sp. NPDC046802 TaxID=3154919 RepID=UPI0033DEC2E0